MANPASAFKAKAASPKTSVKKSAEKPSAKSIPVKAAAKKAAVKKSIVKRDVKIKYEDKSSGQPDLVPYEKGDMKLHAGTAGKALLVNHRPVVIDGRKKPEMWFVSALIQKGYVGFYFMPVYMNAPVQKQLKPELMKCLKGQACFHIKKADPVIYGAIKEAMKIGFDDYRKRGWI
jgi:hypothetical protein